jgi:hypothetical protein
MNKPLVLNEEADEDSDSSQGAYVMPVKKKVAFEEKKEELEEGERKRSYTY